MPSGGLCGLKPLLFGHRKLSRFELVKIAHLAKNRKKEMKGPKMERSRRCTGNFVLMMELRRKIFTFRDIIDLPPCDGTESINELVARTIKDLYNFQPEIISRGQLSELKEGSIDKVLIYFCEVLRIIGDLWTKNQDWMDSVTFDMFHNNEKLSSEKLVEKSLATLNCVIRIAKEKYDMMDEDEDDQNKDQTDSAFGEILIGNYSGSNSPSYCGSPVTPTSVLPQFISSDEFPNISCSSPLLRSLRFQAVGKLNPIDVKRLAFYMPPNSGTQKYNNNVGEDSMAEIEVESISNQNNSDEDLLFDVESGRNSDVAKATNVDDSDLSENFVLAAPPIPTPLPTPISEDKFGALLPPSEPIVLLQPVVQSNVAASPPPLPPLPPALRPTVTCQQLKAPPLPPPPPAPMLQPNAVAEGASWPLPSLERLSTAPPPPPPPKLQQNVVATVTPLPLSSLQQQLSKPRPPTPPPPVLQPNVVAAGVTLPLPSLQQKPPTPPPPSPPPPLTPEHSNIKPPAPAASPSPPPVTSGTVTAAPPPPPSPTLKTSGTGTAAPSPPPPPTPVTSSKDSKPLPAQAPMPLENGAAPPPPPPGAARSLRPKKAQTKLRRSSQMGNLYRVLKGKLEGGNQNTKSANGRNNSAPRNNSGKQGMADALAEMTKRSAYFQQIEEDVQRYSKSITELKTTISTFKTKDMTELIKFHQNVESILEQLTDETQVLARFEGFPQKKLEALRTAAALYSKLNGILSELQNWKVATPLGQLLDKTERYFNKIKGDLDTLERTKDEESKKFRSHNIDFDFHILVQIKESMVDVSSNCMELALKECRESKASEESKKANAKMLWRAFQFAFKVYTFAGGHDDRADRLTRELAHEIEKGPHHH